MIRLQAGKRRSGARAGTRLEAAGRSQPRKLAAVTGAPAALVHTSETVMACVHGPIACIAGYAGCCRVQRYWFTDCWALKFWIMYDRFRKGERRN